MCSKSFSSQPRPWSSFFSSLETKFKRTMPISFGSRSWSWSSSFFFSIFRCPKASELKAFCDSRKFAQNFPGILLGFSSVRDSGTTTKYSKWHFPAEKSVDFPPRGLLIFSGNHVICAEKNADSPIPKVEKNYRRNIL